MPPARDQSGFSSEQYHLLDTCDDEETGHTNAIPTSTKATTKPGLEPPAPRTSILHAITIGGYFALWYLINVGYNISNKNVLLEIPLYVTVATSQLLIGCVYIMCVWCTGLRKPPVLTKREVLKLMPIAVCHSLGHLAAVVSLGCGAVSFTHIVKSAEPVFTSVLSALLLKNYFRPPVYLTLLPIIAGVSLASLKELDFSWISFAFAMLSNLTSAFRAILSKSIMTEPVGENLTPANLYAVLTILSFFIALPISIAVESWKATTVYSDSMGGVDREGVTKVWVNLLLSGLTYYLYNEVAFLTLSKVHPITHAVGNTIKRVVIIVVTCIVFGNKMTEMGAVGCAVAVVGTFLYSLSKLYFS